MQCPTCANTLVRQTYLDRQVHACPKGCGVYATLASLRPFELAPDLVRSWGPAQPDPSASPCASCGRPMARLRFRSGTDDTTPVEMSACRLCQSLWAAPDQLRLAHVHDRAKGDNRKKLPPEAAAEFAKFEADQTRRRIERDLERTNIPAGLGADDLVEVVLETLVERGPGILRSPTPATWIVFALIFLLSSISLEISGGFLDESFAFIPSRPGAALGLRAFTFPFVHRGLIALVINGLLLLGFASVIERRWGTAKLLVLLFASSATSAALAALCASQLSQHLSGALCFVVATATYLVLRRPRWTLPMWVSRWFHVRRYDVPLWLVGTVAALWLALQLVVEFEGEHLGGAIAGVGGILAAVGVYMYDRFVGMQSGVR